GKIIENSMGDRWWNDTMPRVWEAVKEMVVDQLPTDGEADEDDAAEDAHDVVEAGEEQEEEEEEQEEEANCRRLPPCCRLRCFLT
ncbi:MAG: hypothetical protein VX181_08315, partial [Pseudomonadota bacterium]|nr:hypothetical protein [Pseudomonadota bacterium]